MLDVFERSGLARVAHRESGIAQVTRGAKGW
jgi:hypothetical protein